MPSEYLPILFIVSFVIYPFALTGIAVWIASKTNRLRFVRETTAVFAIIGFALALWFIASNGWGKYAQVTFLGAAVFVFAMASTGAFLSTLLNAMMPERSSDYSVNQK